MFSLLLLTACKEADAIKTLAEDISSDPPISTTKPTVPSIPTFPNTPTEPTEPPVVINELKLSCEEARMVKLINLYRVGNGYNELSVSESGVESTRWHDQDMISKNYFSHTEPSGRTFSERAKSFGYPAWAENIAAGRTSANQTFCQWKNSSGHNANMLNRLHRSMGIGNVNGNAIYRAYWSNNFGPEVNDNLAAPLSVDNCPLPATLPAC